MHPRVLATDRAAADGLLPAGADVGWLTETVAVLVSADPYVHGRRSKDWPIETSADGLSVTVRRLLGLPERQR